MTPWRWFMLLLVTALSVSCDRDEVRVQDVPKGKERFIAAASEPTGSSRLPWSIPESWTFTLSDEPMRYGTLRRDDAPPVGVFRFSGGAGSLSDNINRWRGQIGLDPVTSAEAQDAALRIEHNDLSGYRVTLRGQDETMFCLSLDDDAGATWFLKAVTPSASASAFEPSFLSLLPTEETP